MGLQCVYAQRFTFWQILLHVCDSAPIPPDAMIHTVTKNETRGSFARSSIRARKRRPRSSDRGLLARAFQVLNARLRQAKACLLAFRGKDFLENPCRTVNSFHSLSALGRLTAQINCAYAYVAGACSRSRRRNSKRQPLGDEEALRVATASLMKLLRGSF